MTTAQDSHRLVDWNKLVSESLMPLRVMANHGSHFQGRLWMFDLGGVDIMKVVSSPALVRRTRPDIAAHETKRTFVITLAGQSGFDVRTRGMEGRLRVGDLVILDSSEPSECFHRGCTSISVLVDEKTAKAYLPQIDDLAGHIVRGACGAGMLAATAMRATARCVSGESRQKTLGHLTAALLHAIAGAYSEAYDLKVSPSAPGRRRAQIRWFVERHLHDAELTVLGVAAEFGLSDRYLRMLFEHEDESLAAYIQRRRLEEAARLLSDPSCYGCTVSQIAFTCGFNSLGSFDRAFKAHFQSTPGIYRRLHATRESEYPT